jgi:cytosine/adenosine deaminase-related metal-dependent hydrolase
MEMLSRGNASVVYCPRTHAYFGHAPHRWREMLERGINVAVGTDSCASAPDLNLVDDLRLLRKLAPKVDAETIWKMATINAAKAIAMQDRVGCIANGESADIVTFEASTDAPLEELLRERVPLEMMWISGAAL